VKLRRNLRDQLEPQKGGEHENKEKQYEIHCLKNQLASRD